MSVTINHCSLPSLSCYSKDSLSLSILSCSFPLIAWLILAEGGGQGRAVSSEPMELFDSLFPSSFSNFIYSLSPCLVVRLHRRFEKIWIFFFFFKTGGLVFLDHFDVLMSKMIFKKWKNIILMYFGTKSTLKSYRNRNRIPKRVRLLV